MTEFTRQPLRSGASTSPDNGLQSSARSGEDVVEDIDAPASRGAGEGTDAVARPNEPNASACWCLYLIECRNGSYYAGITNRLDARYAAHVAGRGARYTRANPPLQLLGSRPFPDRAAAARAEWQIRQLPRERKRAFLDLREP